MALPKIRITASKEIELNQQCQVSPSVLLLMLDTQTNLRLRVPVQYLHNPRMYNLSTSMVHGLITVDCNSNPVFAILRIPIMVDDFVFIYDYIFPGHLTYGKVIVTSDKLGMIFTIETPLAGKSERYTFGGVSYVGYSVVTGRL